MPMLPLQFVNALNRCVLERGESNLYVDCINYSWTLYSALQEQTSAFVVNSSDSHRHDRLYCSDESWQPANDLRRPYTNVQTEKKTKRWGVQNPYLSSFSFQECRLHKSVPTRNYTRSHTHTFGQNPQKRVQSYFLHHAGKYRAVYVFCVCVPCTSTLNANSAYSSFVNVKWIIAASSGTNNLYNTHKTFENNKTDNAMEMLVCNAFDFYLYRHCNTMFWAVLHAFTRRNSLSILFCSLCRENRMEHWVKDKTQNRQWYKRVSVAAFNKYQIYAAVLIWASEFLIFAPHCLHLNDEDKFMIQIII